MKTNEALQKDVQDAIKWEPLLHAAEIGVIVNDGIVTLTGTVDNYTKKREAEHAVKSVQGVKAVVEKIEVIFPNIGPKTDNDIASEIVSAYKWNWKIPNDKIQVKVENGWVNLDGEVDWNYQKDAAKNLICDLIGTKGIINNIKIKADVQDEIERKSIERALDRNWSINSSKISVKVSGSKITLSGSVKTPYQKDEASRIAWNAPGVSNVVNDLVLDNNYC
jgi:osmotically-inducible protein OsmY